MFEKWWKKRGVPAANGASRVALVGDRSAHPLDDIDHALTVDFLCRARSILALKPTEAAIAARFMAARRYQAGDVIFREGDATASNFMLLILDGEATVETTAPNPRDNLTMTVMEAGCTMGEMGLMDGGPRSATCTACNTLRCAVLTRTALRQLAAEHPEIAARLMSIICIGISNRLRDVSEKFKRYAVMSNVMREQQREALPNILARET
jgi:CRP/FNR family transcriptional regulator, cyclic AMP receptor protein